MKAASITQIKDELNALPQKEVVALCLRLAKYKKENKELLAYLLFDAHDVEGYLQTIKNEINDAFWNLPRQNWYFYKKGLRKILRDIQKHSRHIGTKEAQVEMLLHFCQNMKNSGMHFQQHTAVNNIYIAQIKKLNTLVNEIHEDLQYDYQKKLNEL